MRIKALIPFAFVLMLLIAPIQVSANANTLAYEGSAGPDSSIGDYTYTHDDPFDDYTGIKNTAGEAYVILNFSIGSDNYLNSFNYSMNGGSYFDDDGAGEFWLYDPTASDWAFIDSFGFGIGIWSNGSYSTAQFTEEGKITIKFNSTDSDGGAGVAVAIAWLHDINSTFITPPEWHEISTAQQWYQLPRFRIISTAGQEYITPLFDEYTYTGFFIFLGLIMIPASLLYFVRGGREKLNADKFFYFLILLFIGIAFFVGGIMP